MKLCIAGSRTIKSYLFVKRTIETLYSADEITEVVSGGCRGVDLLGERWAEENGIPIRQFLPEWDKYGKSAGPRRNTLMAEYADRAIVIIQDDSKGSINMIQQMEKLGKIVSVIRIR